MIARNRFLAATPDEAQKRMWVQSLLTLDAVATIRAFPWVYTNAGVLAEACAHWAMTFDPSLRIDDEY